MKRKTTRWLGCLLATTAIAVTTATAADEAGSSRTQPNNSNHTDRSSEFYAYYTRLDYDDHSNTGQYADPIVQIGTNGRFVFCREFGYLPYWQPSGTKYFVDRLLPVTGDGPPERPDAINKCSYVRLIEGSPDRIVVHWRYAPDLNSPHFTDFQRTYSGDIGSYFADYAEEYFTITADRRITREVKKGCVRLDEWNDPLNKMDGVPAASGPATGAVQDATDLDLFIGMAQEKSYPRGCEREITKAFRSNMVFSGLIDEVRVFDRALDESEIRSDYRAFQPDVVSPLSYWVLPAGPKNAMNFGAAYTRLQFSPEWEGLWRVGDHADIVVSFDDRPNRFVFWRGTNYLPSLITEPGSKGLWVNDQGPENYTDQCYEHMSDKMCRYSHVRLIENTDARVVVHWRNASVGIGYEWLWPDRNGWGLWTDEYWYVYPDAVSVRYQVSGRMAEYPETQSQQNELLNQPGTRPEDNVVPESITIANMDGQTEQWDYSWSRALRKGEPISGEKNLVYLNLRSKYKHFNIAQTGSSWVPYSQWKSMQLAPGFSRYNAWSHYPVGLLPSDGTVATGRDRTSSSCLGTLNGRRHLLKDGRMEAYNIYGLTDLPAADLKVLNRSWNSAPAIVDLNGCQSTGYDQRQKAYVMTRKSERLSFGLNGSEKNPISNPCFVIRGWGGPSTARLKIDGQARVPSPDFRQGIIRDTDGTETMIIWVRQQSFQGVKYAIY